MWTRYSTSFLLRKHSASSFAFLEKKVVFLLGPCGNKNKNDGVWKRACLYFFGGLGGFVVYSSDELRQLPTISCSPALMMGRRKEMIPTDKLACHQNIGTRHGEAVVLVACGSFNPPTAAHVRVLEVVREEYMKRGVDVYGAYMSPVHDGYGKESLNCEGGHRVAMCELAAEDSGMFF
jgi:hypothetical protein